MVRNSVFFEVNDMDTIVATAVSEGEQTPTSISPTSKGVVSRSRRTRKKRSAITDINTATFDPKASELITHWHTNASCVICVNSYPNGITLSVHKPESNILENGAAEGVEEHKYLAEQFALRFKDTRDYQLSEGKYFLHKENARQSLENHLSRLHKKNLLQGATVYFGTTVDPFIAFHKRFDITSACLQLFEQYKPRKLLIQTRSPMVIAALPTLKALEGRAHVGIAIESHLEKSIARYTPGQPKISERLVAAQGLRRQGISVNLQVVPVLPYGDFFRDAWDFAEVLDRHSDFISFGALASGSAEDEKQLKELPVARKLATDKQFRWLRPYAYRYLYHALKVVAPQKLLLPVGGKAKPGQLGLFAA